MVDSRKRDETNCVPSGTGSATSWRTTAARRRLQPTTGLGVTMHEHRNLAETIETNLP